MYALCTEPGQVKDLMAKAKTVLSKLLQIVDLPKKEVTIHATSDLLADPDHRRKLYVISAGNFIWRYEDKNIFILEAGDILGIPEQHGILIGTYASECAVNCDEYSVPEFRSAVEKNGEAARLWEQFLSYLSCAMTWFTMSLMQAEKDHSPAIRVFPRGKTIIEQGGTGDEVFTLIEGAAEVTVDGVKVGEVHCDEIFGVFAALTGNPRSASVITTKESLALVMNKENFLDVVRSRPTALQKLVEDMARTIVDLNKKVVELRGSADKTSLITG